MGNKLNEAGRAFRTILMNIRQIKGETDDGEIIDDAALSKSAAALDSVGIKVHELRNGIEELRNPMDVLKELADKWSSLTSMQQSPIIDALAGKYRGNQLTALLENWATYEKMLAEYAGAAGSAMAENEKRMSSWQTKLNQFSNELAKMWNNAISTDFVKFIIDTGTATISLVDKIGLLPVAIGAATLAFSLFSKTAFAGIMTSVAEGVAALGVRLGMTTVAATGLASAMAAIAPLAIVAGVYGLVKAFDALHISVSEASKSIDDNYAKSKENISNIRELAKEYDSLANKEQKNADDKTKLLQIQDTINSKYLDGKEKLDIYSDAINGNSNAISDNIQKIKDLDKAEAERFLRLNKYNYEKSKSFLESPYGSGNNPYELLKSYEEQLSDVNLNSLTRGIVSKAYDKLAKDINNAEIAVSEYKDAQNTLIAVQDESNKSIEDGSTNSNAYADNIDKSTSKINDVTSELKSLNQVLADVKNGQSLNSEQVFDLIQKYPELTDAISKTSDGWTIEGNALEILRQAKIKEAKDSIQSQIDATKTTISETLKRINSYGIEIDAITDLNSAIKQTSQLSFKDIFGDNAFNDIKFLDNNQIQVGEQITQWTEEQYNNIKESFDTQKKANDMMLDLGKMYERSANLEKLLNDPGFGVSTSGSGTTTSPLDKTADKLKLQIDLYTELEAAIDDAANAVANLKSQEDTVDGQAKIDLLNKEIEANKKLAKAKNDVLWQQEKERNDLRYNMSQLGFDFTGDFASTNLSTNYATRLQEMYDTYNNMPYNTEADKQARADYNDTIQEVEKSYARILQINKDVYSTTNDIIQINKDNNKIQSDITELTEKQLENSLKLAESERDKELAQLQGAESKMTEGSDEWSNNLQQQIELHKENQAALEAEAQQIDEQLAGLDKQSDTYVELKQKRDDLSATWWDEERAIDAVNGKIDDYAKKLKEQQEQAESDYKEVLNQKKENDILAKENEYQKKLINAEENVYGEGNTQAQYEAEAQKRIDALQSQIDAIEQQNDLLDEQAERQKRITEIQELQIQLQNTLNNKNVQVLRKQADGTWQYEYVADQEKVDSLNKEIQDKREDLNDWEADTARKHQVESLQNQIKYEQNMMEAKRTSYEAQKNVLNLALEGEKLAIESHYNNLLSQVKTQMEILKNQYHNDWNAIIADISSQLDKAQSLNSSLNAQKTQIEQRQNELDKSSEKLEAESKLSSLLQQLTLTNNPAQKQSYLEEIERLKKQIASMDTGGFTGSWGNSGKLAILHEKELVLDKFDTSNILKAVDITRNLFSNIKLPSFNSITKNTAIPNQTFNIDKLEFPNVTDSSEIERAINNLPNHARIRSFAIG